MVLRRFHVKIFSLEAHTSSFWLSVVRGNNQIETFSFVRLSSYLMIYSSGFIFERCPTKAQKGTKQSRKFGNGGILLIEAKRYSTRLVQHHAQLKPTFTIVCTIERFHVRSTNSEIQRSSKVLITKITISSIVIGLKNSNFLLY